jgi:hypothetical protein
MGPGLLAGRVSAEHGLLSWSTSARRGVPALTAASMLAQHVVEPPERREAWFLPGFATSTQGFSFTDEIWERLALALARSSAAVGRDALVDAGRLVGDRELAGAARSRSGVAGRASQRPIGMPLRTRRRSCATSWVT